MTTFNDRLTILRKKLEEDTSLVFNDAVIRDDFNQAMRDVVAKTDPPEMVGEYRFNTVANTRTYALPTGFRHMQALYLGTKKLTCEKLWEQDGINVNGTASPIAYAIVDASAYLRPVPAVAASARMTYVKWPTALTGTASTLEVSDDFLPAIEAKVLAAQYEQVGHFEFADRQRNIHNLYMHDLMNQVEDETGADHVTNFRTDW